MGIFKKLKNKKSNDQPQERGGYFPAEMVWKGRLVRLLVAHADKEAFLQFVRDVDFRVEDFEGNPIDIGHQ